MDLLKSISFSISLFLIGAGSQVVMAFLNKIIAWCSYYKHGKDEATIFCVLRLFTAMENWFFIDIIFDVVSLITFGWSIVLIMHLFITT